MTAPAAAEDAFAGLVERQSRFVYPHWDFHVAPAELRQALEAELA